MNCRSFHKNLEDYLQGGLDFSNRFAIERHADECIGCGKDLADATELRRMALDLKRVEAPADFESSLLDKIGVYKANRRFSGIRRFWLYGPELLSWRKLMFASSGLALVLGIIVSSHLAVPKRPAPPAEIAGKPEKVEEKANPPVANIKPAMPAPVPAAVRTRTALPMPIERDIPKAVQASFQDGGWRSIDSQRVLAPDIVKIGVTESKFRPMPMLPKMIWIQYRPASEEYFIQNVSH
jgi:hypothetical protein